uniref:Uncharacterized protein n=1 Tax=Cannabis sativa TaxID=3483 RepID=A0A803NKQ5_CANSA
MRRQGPRARVTVDPEIEKTCRRNRRNKRLERATERVEQEVVMANNGNNDNNGDWGWNELVKERMVGDGPEEERTIGALQLGHSSWCMRAGVVFGRVQLGTRANRRGTDDWSRAVGD